MGNEAWGIRLELREVSYRFLLSAYGILRHIPLLTSYSITLLPIVGLCLLEMTLRTQRV